MKAIFYSLILFAAITLLTGCGTTTGTGEIITESRHVTGFNSIVLESEADIFLSQGPWSVTVKGYENLVPVLKTEVINNQLIISNHTNDIIENNNLEVYVVIPDLVGIEIKGSGDVKTLEPLALNNLTIYLRGMGNINLQGSVGQLHCNLPGTGTIKTCEMSAQYINATLNGTGSIYVFAHQSVNAIITGTGDIGYLGNPAVTNQVTGVGSVFSISNCN